MNVETLLLVIIATAVIVIFIVRSKHTAKQPKSVASRVVSGVEERKTTINNIDLNDNENFHLGKDQDGDQNEMDYIKLFAEEEKAQTIITNTNPLPTAKEKSVEPSRQEQELIPEQDLTLTPTAPSVQERPPKMSPMPSPKTQTLHDELIVILNVMAGEGDRLSGVAIGRTAEALGMRFNKGIYSYYDYSVNRQTPVFRLANMLEPGTFDPDSLTKFATPGITFFMKVPSVMEEVLAFGIMLDKAKQLAVALNAQIYDERRGTLSKQGIEHIIERIREHQRKMKLAQRHG